MRGYVGSRIGRDYLQPITVKFSFGCFFNQPDGLIQIFGNRLGARWKTRNDGRRYRCGKFACPGSGTSRYGILGRNVRRADLKIRKGQPRLRGTWQLFQNLTGFILIAYEIHSRKGIPVFAPCRSRNDKPLPGVKIRGQLILEPRYQCRQYRILYIFRNKNR